MFLGTGLALTRGGGQAAIDPTAISVSAVHRWRADNKTLNGATVSQLSDMIGAMHQAQGTAGSQPTWNSSDATFGGQATVSGTNWFFTHSATAAAMVAPISILLVGYVHGTNTTWFSGLAGSPYDLLWTKPDGTLEYYSGVGLDSAAGTVTAPAAVLLTDDGTGGGAAFKMYYNDFSTPVASGITRWGSTTSVDIGAGQAGLSNASGSWAEMIVYSGALSAADKTTARAYVTQRYGI